MICDCLAKGLSLFVRWIVFVLPRWHLYWLREEFGTPSGLEILFGEGGDVELGAHIFVFAFDPLSLNPLSLFVLCIIHIIHILYACVVLALIHIAIHYMLGLFVCASLVLNHESFI